MSNFGTNKNDIFLAEALNFPSFPLDDTVTWVQENLDPGDVFSERQLSEWAFDNGFKKFE